MRNIRLLIEYEGTGYAGWQVQKTLPTVQGTVAGAIRKLTGEDVDLVGASRTDAGVHAFGQVANFHTSSGIPAYNVRQALNSLLPGDIVVKDASDVPAGFDSRRDSTGKVYLYRVLNRPYPSALMRRFSWFVWAPLDVGAMRDGAAHLIGEKDFSSFRAADSDATHSIREVTSIKIRELGDGVIDFEVRGKAFLRHMIRIMVGTLVSVGKGRIGPGDVASIVDARSREAAHMTAPPEGLFLVKVEYPEGIGPEWGRRGGLTGVAGPYGLSY